MRFILRASFELREEAASQLNQLSERVSEIYEEGEFPDYLKRQSTNISQIIDSQMLQFISGADEDYVNQSFAEQSDLQTIETET